MVGCSSLKIEGRATYRRRLIESITDTTIKVFSRVVESVRVNQYGLDSIPSCVENE